MGQSDRAIGLLGNAAFKVPCRAATTGNITLEGEQTIDGVACESGDRVLVKHQTDGIENGIYTVDTGEWNRAPDFDGAYDAVQGSMVNVTQGGQAGGWFQVSTLNDADLGYVEIGTDTISWAQTFLGSATTVSFTQAGTGAVTRSLQAKLREVELSVKDFGAVGDGVSDDSQAIMDCLDQAFSGADYQYGNLTISFPPGEYLVTEDNVLGQWTSVPAYRQHVTFRGHGRGGATIIFKPGGNSAKYLYNGETNGGGAGRDQQYIFALFEKLAFLLDETGCTAGAELNLFKEFPKAGTPNQNFQFVDCYFNGGAAPTYGGSVLLLRGTVNGAENRFINCRSSAMKHIIDSSNPQAVNNDVLSCDWEEGTGDVYLFTGHSTLNMLGGSVIYNSLAAEAYMLNLQAPAGGITGHFNFHGVRAELNSTLSKILNASGANNAAQVGFRDSDFSNVGASAARTVLSVLPDCPISVLFERTRLSSLFSYEFKAAGTANYQLSRNYNANVEFRECNDASLADRFTWGANALGLFRIRGLHPGTTWNGTDVQIAADADYTGTLGMSKPPQSAGRQLKTWVGQIGVWPDSTTNTDGASSRVQLPDGAILKSIAVRKRAAGVSASAYRLAVTNDDGTYTYGFTERTLAQASEHEFILANEARRLATAVNRVIRVVATKELVYNTQTANFTVGDTITDATTGTTAKILADQDNGTTGVLTIGFITGGTGAFGVGNIITGAGGGSATAGATTTYQGANELRLMGDGDIYEIGYL